MPAPLAHISGLLNGVVTPAAARMPTVLMERWDPGHGLRLVERERITFMIGPPTLFVSMADDPGFAPERVASMRVISSGAMSITPEFVEEARAAYGATVKRTYGSTEAPTVTTSWASDPPERGRDTDGRAVGQVELRTVDPESGRDCGPGETGELRVRGPELFAGYADVELTRMAMQGDWFRTGDLAVMEPGGWITIVGRLKELIIRAGENIAPAEVERTLERHPGITQAVAVGYPDPRYGERVAAFVVADGTFGVDDCRRWFEAEGVARFKTPERVVRVDAIPLLGLGKPDRAALRAQLADGDGTAAP
jgi:acyl-CoA synthetase (AMP-forming)/AMP-acid ligase II